MEYLWFEGVIPKGHYGAGPDIVWDAGTYSPDEKGEFSFLDRAEAQERVRQELAAGKLSIRLRGRKLKGSWTLVKTKQDEQSWLFFKHSDHMATSERDVLADAVQALAPMLYGRHEAGRTAVDAIDEVERLLQAL